MVPRFDLTFSYWVFAWFLFYELDITKYNPKIWLLFGLIENIILLLMMIYYKHSQTSIILFVIINVFIKILPILILRDTPYKTTDFISGILLLGIYIFWVFINLGSLDKIKQSLSQYVNKLQNGEPTTPLVKHLTKTQKIENFFSK